MRERWRSPTRAWRGQPRNYVTESARKCGSRLLDVALGLRGLAGVPPRHQHQALELGDEDAVLVEDAGVDLDHAAVGLRFRGLDLEHLGLAEEGVAVEDRVGVAEVFRRQVGDRLARDVGYRHA